jgi:hypothetical protein
MEEREPRVYDEDEGFMIEAVSSEEETFTVWIEKKEVDGKKKGEEPVEVVKEVVPEVQVKTMLPPITSMEQQVSPADLLLSASSFSKQQTAAVKTRPRGNPHANASYKVIRWEQDNHNGGAETTTTLSTWDTYEKAKKAASKILLDEHDRDWFEQYQEEETAEESGGFEVWARCPEGEVLRIYIEETPTPIAEWTPVTKAMYTIVSRRTDGGDDLCLDVVYESLEDANKAARAFLVYDLSDNQYPTPKENEEKHLEATAKSLRNLKEENEDSKDKPYTGSTDQASVEVRKLKVMPSITPNKASQPKWTNGTDKRRREQIADIGNRSKKQKTVQAQEESDDEIVWLGDGGF